MGASSWTAVSRLLDEALDLPPAGRAGWLNRLGPEHDAAKPRLSALLAPAGTAGDRFMATLPKLDPPALDGDAAPAHHDPSLSDGAASRAGARVGPYTLVRPIAGGGQGMVWLAERSDGVLARPVALKLPHGLAFRPGLAERMTRERDILAALAHPHIARLYDAGVTADGEPYLALEYVDGSPIDRHCAVRELSIRDRVRLFLQVVRAVAYAHGQLVIHRDLKPSNILVTSEGYVRLLDFGIAKLLDADALGDSTLTTDVGRALTLPYASPEQVLHESLGVTTDVYSLGVVLYELVSGVRPHRPQRESAAALEEAILFGDVRRPSEATASLVDRKTLAGDLDTVVLKALARSRSERYATAEAFADDLERALDGRPVLAQPDSPTYRARKFVGRHRGAVAACVVSTVAVFLGLGVSLWQARVARAERDAAITQRTRAEAAAGFLDWLLQQAGTDRPLTSMELLDRGAARLERTDTIDDATRGFLRYELSKHYLRVNQTDREMALLVESAKDARRAGDAEVLAAAECAAAAAIVGRDRAAAEAHLASADAVFATVSAPSPNTRIDCLRARAQVWAFQGRADAALQLLEAEWPALANQPDHGWVRRGTLDVVLTGLYRRAGRFVDAQRVAESTVEFMRARGQAGTMNEFAALGTVAINLDDLGEVRRALAIYRRLVDWFEGGQFASVPMVTLTNAGAAELRAGRVDTALRLAGAAQAAGRRAGNDRVQAAAALLASRARLELGRAAEAWADLERAEAFWSTNPAGHAQQLVDARLHRAALLAAEGRTPDARAVVAGVLAGLGGADLAPQPALGHAHGRAATLALRAGDPSLALTHASAALAAFRRVARDQRQSADVGEAAFVRARALAALGRTDEARHDAATAETALTAGLGPDHALTTAARALAATLGS